MKRFLACGVALALGSAGCSVVNAGRQSSAVDACAATLSAGKTVAGESATLTGVRRLTVPQTDALLAKVGAPALVPPTAPPTPVPSPSAAPGSGTPDVPNPMASLGTARLCALSFAGHFTKTSLPADPAATGVDIGRGLLVVVTSRRARVVAVSVVTSADSIR